LSINPNKYNFSAALLIDYIGGISKRSISISSGAVYAPVRIKILRKVLVKSSRIIFASESVGNLSKVSFENAG
jgi:hypothetical protein